MGLWKRGRRYWTQTVVNGVWIRRPLCPEGSTHATTNWQEAVRLEKELVRAALQGHLPPQGHSIKLFAAVDDYLKAKKATANTERAIEFDRERLEVVKRVLGDVKLSSITPRTIEGFQAKRRLEGAGNRTVNMDIGALRQVLKRFKQWRRLEDDVKMLTESGGEPIGRVLTNKEQERLLKTAEDNPEWEHVWCAAQLAANTSMRGVEVKHVRRKDFDAEKRVVHIRSEQERDEQAGHPVERLSIRRSTAYGPTRRSTRAHRRGDTTCGARASITSLIRRSPRASGTRLGVRCATRRACQGCDFTTCATRSSHGYSKPANLTMSSSRSLGTSRAGCWSTTRISACMPRRPRSIGLIKQRRPDRRRASNDAELDRLLAMSVPCDQCVPCVACVCFPRWFAQETAGFSGVKTPFGFSR